MVEQQKYAVWVVTVLVMALPATGFATANQAEGVEVLGSDEARANGWFTTDEKEALESEVDRRLREMASDATAFDPDALATDLGLPYAEGSVPEDFAADVDAAIPLSSSTRCMLNAPTVCATAIASPYIDCGVTVGVKWCKGGTAIGAYGTSPTGLPGRVSWSGSSVCGNDCSGSGAASGSASWSGTLWSWGASDSELVTHSLETSIWSCVTYSVSGASDAFASPAVFGIGVPVGISASTTDGNYRSQC